MSLRRRMGCGVLCVLSVLAGSAIPPAAAHGALHEQIAAVTSLIERDPTNAELYLKRGTLQSDHGEWKAALADFDRAVELDPSLVAVDLARGRTWLRAGQFARSKAALDRFLAHQPTHPEALALRARVHAQLRQWEASAADYTGAIARLARLGRPNPDYYLQRARVVAERGSGHALEALKGLDEGMAVLGPLVSLQGFAIELELSLDRTDAALARLGLLAAQSPRPESWLVRAGETLERAGRVHEARSAFEQARVAITSLPSRHRETRGTLELEERLEAGLARLSEGTDPARDGSNLRRVDPRTSDRPQ